MDDAAGCDQITGKRDDSHVRMGEVLQRYISL